MWSFFILALFGLVSWSSSAKCPADYERFSLEHTFCISRNPRCDIKRLGVSQQDIQEILRLHNQYRSDLALGKETRAKGGTLPKAADMLQMVWDDELAAIAQKWAENCDFNHDCDECRVVPNFGVGQNLAIQFASCSNCKEDDITKPKWADAIKGLYDEVLDFHKSWLDNFQSGRAETDVEHFTQ
ncbi:CRISP/Allergen/PR-1, partial [Araneus ventricosus]